MHRNYFKPIILILLSYIIVMTGYYALSVNLGNTPLYLQMRRFIPAAICFALPFFIVKNLKLYLFLPSLITAFLYSFTSPFLVYHTYNDSTTYLSLPYDFAFGMYIFPLLVFLNIALAKAQIISNVIYSFILSLLHILLWLPVLTQIFYYIKFSHCLTEKGTMAIWQTNIDEAIEYIHSLGFLGIAAAITIFILTIIIYKFYSSNYAVLKQIKLNTLQKSAAVLLIFILSFYAGGILWHKAYFGELIISTQEYFQNIKLYRNNRNGILASLTVENKIQNETPHTIVVVIGESASRNFMSAFSDTKNNTTPWLKSQKNNPNFILFDNAYSCEYSTGPSLSHALTEANYYTDQSFNRSLSFIDIAKKAGYDTYWLFLARPFCRFWPNKNP